jgi:integrase
MLWRRFSIYLRREVAKRAGLTQRDFPHFARVSFAKVAEYQKPGHGPLPHRDPDRRSGRRPHLAPDLGEAEPLTDAIGAAARKATVNGPVLDDQAHTFAFGRQLDVRPIRSADFDGAAELTERAVAAYVRQLRRTAHHVHRTIRVALGEAVQRGHIPTNAAEIAKAPRLEEEDIEPYSIEEVQSLLLQASKLRNSTRWVVALALGLRQGEALGLHWEDVDLDAGYVRIRKNRLRPRYRHGCGDGEPCGRKDDYFPQREQTRREHKSTKSRAGRRTVGLPDPLIKLLRQHRAEQNRERAVAGSDWEDKGYVFASPTGGPLSPNTDYHVWKQLLRDAGVRDGRLHDARHTAATVLLLLGVPDVVVDSITGWEPGGAARMRARYMHITRPMLRNVAQQVGDMLWEPPKAN